MFLAATASIVLLSGCGLARDDADSRSASPSGFPTQVENCGHQVDVQEQPQRVVALGPSEVTTVVAAGGADRLAGRNDSGARSAPYPKDLRAAVTGVPQLGSGSGEITRESLIDKKTDLVVGSVTESLTPDSLQSVGIPMLSLRGNCGSEHAPGEGDGTADFDDVYADVKEIGGLLGTSDKAEASVKDMRSRVEKARSSVKPQGTKAASVIVARNSLEAYGSSSMAHTQFETLGATNVFGDVESRVFDVSIEKLVEKDPEVIVLLSYDESNEEALKEFLAIPGASSLSAVRKDAVFVQPYEYSSQGTLSVNGLENMAMRLNELS